MNKEINELEEKLRLAMLNSDVSVLDELISSDLLFTNHLGVLVSKQEDLDAHSRKAFVFDELNLSDSKILPQVNSAIVSVKAEIKGTYNGQRANGTFRFTRVWLNTSSKWQVVAAHSSLIA